MKPLSMTAMATVIALGGALATTPAMARGPMSGPTLPEFSQLDADGSGTVTLQDMQTYAQTRRDGRHDQMVSALMDHANDDGMLDEQALRQGLDSLHQGRHAQRSDASDDRRAQMGARIFERMDTNDDGVIDAAEYEAFTARMAERMENRTMRGHHRKGQPRNN